MKPISDQKQQQIKKLCQDGLSVRQVASRTGVSFSTVAAYRSLNSPQEEKSKGGRPQKLTQYQKRLLARKVTSGAIGTAAEAHRELNSAEGCNVSYQTVRNSLKEQGLKAAKMAKKPLLQKRHIKERLNFAKKYESWTVEDWKRVIFSDETKINRFGSDGVRWCWKKQGTSIKPQHVQGTVKFGGGSLMLWGCMTAHGVGNCCRIDGGLDADLYCNILGDELLRTLDYYQLGKENVIFSER